MTKSLIRKGDKTYPTGRPIGSNEGGRGKSFDPVTITLPSAAGTYQFLNGALYRDGERQAGRGM